MINKRIKPVLFLLGQLAFCAGATESVDINLNVRHEVGGVSELDRETYFVLHASAGENTWDSDEQETSFLNDYDVYLGRANGTLPWNLSETTEDPSKPGWCDHDQMLTRGNSARSKYASDTHAQSLESRASKMMIGGQMDMLYPVDENNANGFVVSEHAALADFYEYFLSDFYGTGGTDGAPVPGMIEVVNEPFVAASRHNTTREDISSLHTNVAAAIHNSHPDVLVGGYCAAHPQYEGTDGNFSHWDANWKTFIDIAGEDMDFFSLHLYDNPQSTNVLDVLSTQYRSGSNVEALLDMVEHYSMIRLGEVKPFNISEFGSLSITNGIPYDPTHDWVDVRSYSTILMQLLERPDHMLQTIPFMMVQAEWGRKDGYPYPTRLLYDVDELTGSPKDTDGPFDFTQRLKFWELWKEVRGTRVDTIASDPDIQVDAYVNRSNAFVIVNSLDHTGPQTVDLNMFGSNRTLQHVVVKHTYADETGMPTLDHYTNSTLNSITLPASSTAVIKYVYSGPVSQDITSTESKYYATTYLQPISEDAPIEFNITNVTASAQYGEALLRLGIGRAHEKSLNPTLLLNGTRVSVPTDWRGYDQETRPQFFGVIEIPVAYDLLQSNNTISVEFGDTGGHVSSVALQVFEFSSDIRNPSNTIPVDFHRFTGSDLVLGFTNGPANSLYSLLSKTNLLDPNWMISQTNLPTDAFGFGSVTNPVIHPREFFKLIPGDPAKSIEFAAPDYADGALDGQQNWNAESGWTVSDSAASGHATTLDNASAAVLDDPVQLEAGYTYSLRINLQFGGTYSTPTNYVYAFLGGMKNDSSALSVGTSSTAADANIQLYSNIDRYRLLNGYSGIAGASSVNDALNEGDLLQFDYSLTLGTAASNTFYTVRLQNLTDGTDTGTGTVSGVDETIYTALTGSGAYGFFQSIAPGARASGLTGVQINSVTTDITP